MPADVHALLRCQRVRTALGPIRVAECDEDPVLLEDELRQRARTILDVSYDAGTMVANGCNSVVEWCGHHFVWSSDWGYSGPFATLEAALSHEAFCTETPCASLRSRKLGIRRLLAIAKGMVSEEGAVVTVNDQPYRWSGDRFVALDRRMRTAT